jgi:hypothetical protein
VLAGGAWIAYRELVVRAPDRVFERFADAWAREDTPAAVALTDGEAVKKTVESKILRGVLKAPMEAYRGNLFAVEQRESDPRGEVTLTAKQVVRFDPPGITSGIGGAMAATFRHVATLKKTHEGWRIVSFEPTFLEAVSTRPGR